MPKFLIVFPICSIRMNERTKKRVSNLLHNQEEVHKCMHWECSAAIKKMRKNRFVYVSTIDAYHFHGNNYKFCIVYR